MSKRTRESMIRIRLLSCFLLVSCAVAADGTGDWTLDRLMHELAGVEQQGRALIAPDLAVEARRVVAAAGNDHQVEEQPPEQPGRLDDTRVTKYLAQVGSNCRRGRRCRSPVILRFTDPETGSQSVYWDRDLFPG